MIGVAIKQRDGHTLTVVKHHSYAIYTLRVCISHDLCEGYSQEQYVLDCPLNKYWGRADEDGNRYLEYTSSIEVIRSMIICVEMELDNAIGRLTEVGDLEELGFRHIKAPPGEVIE